MSKFALARGMQLRPHPQFSVHGLILSDRILSLTTHPHLPSPCYPTVCISNRAHPHPWSHASSYFSISRVLASQVNDWQSYASPSLVARIHVCPPPTLPPPFPCPFTPIFITGHKHPNISTISRVFTPASSNGAAQAPFLS